MINFDELIQRIEHNLALLGIEYREEEIEIPNFKVGSTVTSISPFMDNKVVVGKIQKTTIENVYLYGELRTDDRNTLHVYIDNEKYLLGVCADNKYSISSWQVI